MFLFIALAAAGTPPLNVFAGEYLLILGVFEAGAKGSALMFTLGIIALSAIIWWTLGILRAYRLTMLEEASQSEKEGIKDVDLREILLLTPIVLLILLIGLFSPFMTEKAASSVERTLDLARRETVAVETAVTDDSAVDLQNGEAAEETSVLSHPGETVTPVPAPGDTGGDPE